MRHDSATPSGSIFARSARNQITTEWLWVLLSVGLIAASLIMRTRIDAATFWLDEAQSAAIVAEARQRGWSGLIDALRADGHPPLWYVLMWGWTELAGDSDAALRLPSALFGALTVVGAMNLTRRIGQHHQAPPRPWRHRWVLTSGALIATNPFMIRYSTEVRMYSLVSLLVVIWWGLWTRLWDQDRTAYTPGRRSSLGEWLSRVGLILVVTAMVLTHYWTFFMFAGWGLWWLWQRRFDRASWWVLSAHVLGAAAFIPWVGSLLFQLRHTGTPWSQAPNPLGFVVTGFAEFAGGRDRSSALALMVLLAICVSGGILARWRGSGRIDIDLFGQSDTARLATVVGTATMISLLVVMATNTAFAPRYLAIIAPLVLIVAARGIEQFGPVAGTGVLLVVAGLSLVESRESVADTRSHGATAAAIIWNHAQPGDVVMVCPDQLGPATVRYLIDEIPPGAHPDAVPFDGSTIEIRSYPTGGPAGRVDWIDYTERHRHSDPEAVAIALAEELWATPTTASVWVVWNEGYLTLEGQCQGFLHGLQRRGGASEQLLHPDPLIFEPMALTRVGAPYP